MSHLCTVAAVLSTKKASAINGPVFALNFDFGVLEVYRSIFEYDVTKRAAGIVRNRNLCVVC